ncbi:MAG: hypothetical protein GC192_22035 [Bacteroidetes bacterium]|nr:hypothetical protein [Bacteroidota bacterium]
MTIVKIKVRRTAWRTLTQAKLPNYANNVYNLTKDVPAYAYLDAKVDVLKLKSDALAGWLDVIGTGNHSAMTNKNLAIPELYAALEDVATGLEENATTAAFIVEAGMEVHKTPVRHVGDLMPVFGFVAVSNGLLGEALLTFNCPTEQRGQITTFAVEWSDDNKQTWHNGTYKNAERIVMKGLPNRVDIYFRVCCLGTHGRKSSWSSEVEAYVL